MPTYKVTCYVEASDASDAMQTLSPLEIAGFFLGALPYNNERVYIDILLTFPVSVLG